MRLLWPEAMQALDRRTIDELGLPEALLMDAAGRGVVEAICRRLGADGGGRLATVLCGAGNNGGDGLVVARLLADRGFRVHVFGAGELARLSPASRLHADVAARLGLRPRWSAEPLHGHELKNLHRSLLRSAVIVDALVGVGPSADLREPLRTWVAQLDGRHQALTVAIDLPSGLCARSGRVLGAAARVDLVVAVAAAKPGLWLGAGPEHWKELEVVEIGVPRRWIEAATPSVRVLDAAEVRPALPPRPLTAYKGTFGHVLVVAGSPGRSGAALLSAQAALRAGAGLVTLATHGEARARLEGLLPDLMVEAIRGGAAEAARVAKLLAGKQALVVGPGLGTGAAEHDLVGRICEGTEAPLVLDADALQLLADKPDLAQAARGRLVLTPHPGEAARLLGSDVPSVEADRVAAAHAIAARWGAVVVLKGARTLVSDGAELALQGQAEPALAVAGSGDVLAGVIGSLLAQGCTPWQAACVAVWAHARAGGVVAARVGRRASIASDVVAALAEVWRGLDGAAEATAVAASDDDGGDAG